ncbi:hypothetical protein N7456_011559 [Penicillium angulare]|uniref:Clr5 domain-containing protein n=1 Tax=Penicillium angulare TaxID=116970 RepID=A0A9W9JZY8_9EURO|nr:hypothetical protein N7456_011559 [Penicillium angulare]
MPRPRIDLEPYKDEIVELFPNASHKEIIDHLQKKYDIVISRTTLKDRLRAWELLRPSPNIQSKIRDRVKELLPLFGTKDILKILADEGTPSSSRTLERIRRRLGVSLRLTPEERKNQLNIDAILQAKAAIGELEIVNRQNVYYHLRRKGLYYTEAQVRLICKALRPAGQRQLQPTLKRRRKSKEVPEESNNAGMEEGESQLNMELQMALPNFNANA